MSTTSLTLAGTLSPDSVVAFHQAALAALDAGGDVTVDLTGVDELHGAHAQVLVALGRDLSRAGRHLVLHGTPPSLAPLVEWCNLSAFGG